MKQYLILIILLSYGLAACSRLERTPEPTPTVAPTLTVAQMGPVLPPTATITLTSEPSATPEPSATASATLPPTATSTPTVRPSRTPTAPPEVSFSQDGEALQDGWIRYSVPDSQILVELPEGFVVVQMNESSLDEMMDEVEQLFPEIGEEIDLRRLFEQNIRLFALDLQEVEQTGGQFAANITISVLPVGETPLEALLLINSAEMNKQGAINITEPRAVSYPSYGTAQARIIDYDLPIGNTTVRGRQLYLLADETLHVMTASHLPNENYSALLDNIISRIQVVEGE